MESALFSEKIDAAIAGKTASQQIGIIAEMVAQARQDSLAGYGPPNDEIHAAVRRFNQIFDAWIAERLPSTAKEWAPS